MGKAPKSGLWLLRLSHTYDLDAEELVELDARGVQVVHGEVARLVVEGAVAAHVGT